MNIKLSISNILILISIVFTIMVTFDPSFYNFGMNNYYLSRWEYHIFFMQFFTSQFLHWWPLHLMMNSIFIYVFGNAVEWIIWEKKYIVFYVFSAIFIGLSISFLSSGNTVWMSGFAMAIIAYYTLQLKSINHPDYKWGITALTINVFIWFVPGISLIWHLFWAIAWWIYFWIIRLLKK